MNKRIKKILPLAIAAMAVLAGSALAGDVIFSEDFESPVVTGSPFSMAAGGRPYTGPTIDSSKWIRAASGYGSGSNGQINKDGGDFTADEGNDQVYAFRYTNSGVTTAAGVIGELALGVTYTVSFDVAQDVGGASPYTAQLIAFGEGAARNDCRSTPADSTVLTSAGGNATTNHMGTTITFEFTADPVDNAASIGKDLGIRFRGFTTSSLIDNVQVEVPYTDPNFPTVYAGDNLITWSGESVAMDPCIVEAIDSKWTSLTYQWTADAPDGYTVDIDPNTGEAPTVTITKDDPAVGGDMAVIIVILEVNDEGRTEPGAISVMSIDVYDNACAMGIDLNLIVYDETDLNTDCVTNLTDFAEVAVNWLNDYATTVPQPKPIQ